MAVLAASTVVVAGLLYAYVVYVFDLKTLLVSVVMPLVLGSVIFSARRQRILLFAFLAYIWAVVDDAPVYFDSVLTWPEVTRFHPFLPRLYMNIVIHSLTLFFLYLAVRESTKEKKLSGWKIIKLTVLSLTAFVLAYAQNIPLAGIQNIVDSSWYEFDVVAKVSSIVFFYFTVRASR